MNSIRRARRRPRVRSVNLSSFRWVLQREAAMRVLFPHALGREDEHTFRSAIAGAETWEVKLAVARVFAAWPERRSFGVSAVERFATLP